MPFLNFAQLWTPDSRYAGTTHPAPTGGKFAVGGEQAPRS